MTPAITLLDALDDADLLGGPFQGDSWATWRAILRAAFALPMSVRDLELFRAVAKREPPARRVRELWVVAGRRSGKDSVASVVAAYAGGFHDYRPMLRPGERALVSCLAVDRDQAGIVLGYIKAFFGENPLLAGMIRRETLHGLELDNGVDVQVHTNDFRAVRGRTVVLGIFDECAFWISENSTRPDSETYRAIRPGLATIPGSMLIGISSPYRRSGLLWDRYRKYFGQPSDDVLVIQAPTLTLNPTLDPSIVAEAIEDDPEAAAAEWLGQFRSDLADFVAREVLDAAIATGRHELPPIAGTGYVAFVDPSGGSADSMTLAVAHRGVAGQGVLDAVRERRPPFSPDSVVEEFAALLKAYGLHKVTGDRYGGEWPRERFREHGIAYEPSERTKSQLYLELLPLLNAGRTEMLDLPRLVAQLAGLERRTARGGRDSIDHAPGQHDDVANAAAGALVLAAGELTQAELWSRFGRNLGLGLMRRGQAA